MYQLAAKEIRSRNVSVAVAGIADVAIVTLPPRFFLLFYM
jgi:hypothetical protein